MSQFKKHVIYEEFCWELLWYWLLLFSPQAFLFAHYQDLDMKKRVSGAAIKYWKLFFFLKKIKYENTENPSQNPS